MRGQADGLFINGAYLAGGDMSVYEHIITLWKLIDQLVVRADAQITATRKLEAEVGPLRGEGTIKIERGVNLEASFNVTNMLTNILFMTSPDILICQNHTEILGCHKQNVRKHIRDVKGCF